MEKSRVENSRLSVIKTVSQYPTNQMGYGVDGASMSGVVNIKYGHQNIVDRLDYPALEQHHSVTPIHGFVFHVFANSGDQMETLLIVALEVFADIALIAETLAADKFKEFV